MMLWHVTDPEMAASIAAEGFRGSVVLDSVGSEWLGAESGCNATAQHHGALVGVELADEVAERYRGHDRHDVNVSPRSFLVPCDVLNAHRPFVVLPEPPCIYAVDDQQPPT
ncbi:MAG: hypothetical protein Q8R60_08790 [Mycobacteriales bacterium]|nr:hypothetical protein [Mycobacteriales bacterium]